MSPQPSSKEVSSFDKSHEDIADDAPIRNIIVVGTKILSQIQDSNRKNYNFIESLTADSFLHMLENWQREAGKLDAIFLASSFLVSLDKEKFLKARKLPHVRQIPIIAFGGDKADLTKEFLIKFKIDDLFYDKTTIEKIDARINVFQSLKAAGFNTHGFSEKDDFDFTKKYTAWKFKRAFDISFAALSLFILSPLFMVISLIIKMSSKGPVIYKSKRAGKGYNIFDFYKFRSMFLDADKKLQLLKEKQNQYKNGNQFIKIANDPRVTPAGRFLRNTSLDELPQLYNVLKGDMSIVGNRPLPLYEAELLTVDDHAERFLGPAGITGLWQVVKRGKKEMSGEERILLDRIYARKSSLLFDIRLMIMTIPALLQSGEV